MSYADYVFYKNEYYGQVIEEADFPRLALRASSFIDYYTQGRAAKNPDLAALKMACCALAEQYQLMETARQIANKSLFAALESDGGEVQSETVGSWSKTFRGSGDTAASVLSAAQSGQTELVSILRQYLAGTGMLYRGRRRCCK